MLYSKHIYDIIDGRINIYFNHACETIIPGTLLLCRNVALYGFIGKRGCNVCLANFSHYDQRVIDRAMYG